MNRVNYFELIEASPEWNERQIANHVRNFTKVEGHVKQEAMRKLLNPQERMAQELKTFHSPDYSAETPQSEKFIRLLDYLLNCPAFTGTISPNLMNYLYTKLTQHPLFSTLSGDARGNQSIYTDIVRDLERDPWILHSFALLHERCALYLEDSGRADEALLQWQISLEFWMKVLSDNEFFKGTCTYKNVAGTQREELCRQVWEEMPKSLLEERYESFKACMDSSLPEKACSSYKAVDVLRNNEFISSDVLSYLDRMQSELLREADSIFLRGSVKTGFTGDYEAVFTFLRMLRRIIGCVERLLLYEAGKYESYYYELKTSKSFEIGYKKVKNFKEVEKDLNEIKRLSSQQFIIEQAIKDVYDRMQDLAVECSNSGKHRMSIEIFKQLPGDRYIKVGQEKKSMKEVISIVEGYAINSGDYWTPEGETRKPTPSYTPTYTPTYTPQPPKPQPPKPRQPTQTGGYGYGDYKPRKRPVGKWMGIMAALIALMLVAWFSLPQNRPSSPVAGQSGGAETQATNQETTETSFVSKITSPTNLKVTYYSGYQLQATCIKALIRGMAAKNSLLTFTENEITDYNQFYTALPTQIAAGDAPDIVFSHPYSFQNLIESGNFMDLTGRPYLDNFYDVSFKTLYTNGKLYALPLNIYSLGVFYNRSVLEKAGLDVPKTASEFFNACESLKSQGYRPLANNFADNGLSVYVVFDTLINMATNLNPGMVPSIKNKSAKYGDIPEFKECIRKYSELLKYSNYDTSSTGADVQYNELVNGTAGMYVFYSAALDDIVLGKPDADIGFFGLPFTDNAASNKVFVAADNAVMVSSSSKFQDACDEFLAFIASKDGALAYLQGSNLLSAVKDCPVTSPYKAVYDLKSLIDGGKAFGLDTKTEGLYYADNGKSYQTILDQTSSGNFNPEAVISQLDSN